MKLKISTLIFALCASTCLLVAAVSPSSHNFRGLQEVSEGSQDTSVTVDTTDQGATNNNPVVVTQDSETSTDNTSPIPIPEPAVPIINISPIPIPEPAVPVEPMTPVDPTEVNPEVEVEVDVPDAPDAPDANNTTAPTSSNNITITGLGALIQALNNASNATNATIDAVTISQLAATTSDAGVQYSGVVTVSNDQGESIEGLVSGVSDQTDGTLTLNITAYLAPVVSNTDADGFTEIDAETVAQNATVNGALSFGLASIVDRGIGQRKIPPAEPNYNITAFYGAQYKDFDTFTRFKFQISATNALNYRINANITIDYNLARQTYRLNGYWYHSWNYPLSAFPPLPPVDNTTNTTNSTEPVNNGTTVDNSTIPVPGNNQTDNTTEVDTGSNSTNTTDPNAGTNTTNVTVPVNTTTADGYTIVDVNTVAQNETLQNVLNWGVNAIVQKGISQYKVPPASPEYTITALYDAQYRVSRTGVWYKFNFRATNSLNYWLNANITVFQRNSNQSLALNGYWYYSWNYPSSAIPPAPTTNTTASTNTTNTSTAPTTTTTTTPTSTGTTNSDAASASTPAATTAPTQPVPGDVNFPTEPVFVNPNVDASVVSGDGSV